MVKRGSNEELVWAVGIIDASLWLEAATTKDDPVRVSDEASDC